MLENRKRRKSGNAKPEMTPGEKYFDAHQAGQRLTLRQAVLAQCAACTSMYADGRVDCEMPECSLHPFMPYRIGRDTELKRPGRRGGNGEGLRKWREAQAAK